MSSRHDAAMRAVLQDLALVSQVGAARPAVGGAGSDEKLGGNRPPGDLGAEAYARQYGHPFHACTPRCHHHGPAADDYDREKVLAAAKADLEQSRGHGLADRERPVGETPVEYRDRVLAETRGDSPAEVAQSRHAISQRTLRKWRRDAGRDTETGEMLGSAPLPSSAVDRRHRARQMRAQGHSVRSIAMQLKVAASTVHAYLTDEVAA
jgi:transposase-like protein